MSMTVPGLDEVFARRVRAWVVAQGGDPVLADLLAQVASSTVLKTQEGHVCVELEQLAAPSGLGVAQLRGQLLGSGLVGTPTQRDRALFVLDEADRLYLHRYYDYEERLGRRIARALALPALAAGPQGRSSLTALFGAPSTDGTHWQAAAAALALQRRLLIVSGGPGTGKTTTVARLLACLVADQPRLRVGLTAPTGKAAARLGSAIQRSLALLPEDTRERLSVTPTTVHRLLGYRPEGFAHHAGHRLPLDVVVVDEASMLDVSLAAQLLEAVPDEARIILLGDRDQLEAVESGAVFSQLCATRSFSPAQREALALATGVPVEALAVAQDDGDPMQDAVIWFTRNFRFHEVPAISTLALAVQGGDAAGVLAQLEQPGEGVRFLHDKPAARQAILADLCDGYAPYYQLASDPTVTAAALLQAFERFRVLSATREGPWGVHALNQHLARPLASAGRSAASGVWYPGRPVLVTRNDPLVGLYNGDVGVALPAADGAMRIWFDGGAAGLRAFAPSQLPTHETAFAMTVHKSQGSEFQSVAVVLPDARSPLLSRELLYTGITRARAQVLLVGTPESLRAAVDRPSRRLSGLRDRIRTALDGTAGHRPSRANADAGAAQAAGET